MAEPISGRELRDTIIGQQTPARDALLNPNTNVDRFGQVIDSAVSGTIENLNNLTGNVVDIVNQGAESDFAKRAAIINTSDDNVFMQGYEHLKNYFGDTDSGVVDSLLGEGSSARVANKFREVKQRMDTKDQLSQQYSGGTPGSIAGELVTGLPVLTVGGTLARTKGAFASGATKLDVAKAVSADTLENAGVFGATEFLLAKTYGKTDAEAVADASMAAIIGGVGTPLVVGAGRGLAKVSESSEEAVAQAAGGGKPPQTKSGREIDSEEVAQSKQAVEDVEFDVVEPKANVGKPIPEQNYVPEVNNPKKFTYGYDDRGRVYTEEASLLGPQGTATEKASLRQRVRPDIEDAKSEVDRRLEFFDRDDKLRQRYGQAQAKTTEKPTQSQSRLSFERDQYSEIMRSKELPKPIRQDARAKLQELRSKEIDVTPTEVKQSAQSKLDQQTEIKTSANRDKRDADLREEYKAFTQAKGKQISTQPESATVKSIETKANESKGEVKKAIRKVTIAEKKLNKDFDISNISPENRKAYRDEVATIEDFTNAKADLLSHAEGKLSTEELRYRESRRIDDRTSRLGEQEFKTEIEAQDFRDELAKEFENIGVNVEKKPAEFKQDKSKTGGVEDPAKKAEREKGELADAKSSNEAIQRSLAFYKRKGTNPRIKSGAKAGQKRLSESQIKDIDEGILSIEEIANKSNPVSTKGGRTEAVETARSVSAKKVTESRQAELGIKDSLGVNDKLIKFKDTVIDASNSVMQITSVLLSSARIAKLSKLHGGNADVRDMIGADMSSALGRKVTKEDVKPIFMTENYGQGERGLVRNIMKDQKLSRADAEEFLREYQIASDKLMPEMVAMRKLVYDQMENNPKGVFKWKLPDGFPVEFTITKTRNGTFSMRGKDIPIVVKTNSLDDMSRALMPNLIHSVDAYVARRMNKAGIPTVHDAFVVPKGKEKFVDDEYTRVMSELNESNLLDDILRDIGYKGPSLKVGDLDSAKIAESGDKLGVEHEAGVSELAKPREFDVSKQSTKAEVMRDFMASGNVRETPTKQLIDAMVNESGMRTMSVAREGDDVFERQIAMAHQSPNYNLNTRIPAPEGVDVGVWDSQQFQIFTESRAKLEFNPLLDEVLQGERRHFNMDGSIVGGKFEAYDSIVKREMEVASKLAEKVNPTPERDFSKGKLKTGADAVIEGKIDVPNLKKKAFSFEKKQDVKAEDIENITFWQESKNFTARQSTNDYKILWDEQTKLSPVYNEFNQLENIRNIYKSDVDRKAEIVHGRIASIPKPKQAELKKLLDADYESIRGMTKEQADSIWKESAGLYNIVRREVDQMSKGIGKKSEQYGAYLNNGMLVANRYNLPEGASTRIEQLVSIKAMNDLDAWDISSKYAKDADANFVLDTMGQNRKLSENVLFDSNPHKRIKGWNSEVFRGSKRINEEGKVVWDAEGKAESGVVGREMESAKVGKIYDGEKPVFNGDLEAELDWMTKKNLKKDQYGYRKIGDEAIRLKAGKVEDLANVLAETTRSVSQKVKERSFTMKVLEDLAKDESTLFSKTAKDGMKPLTDEQAKRLPFELRNELKYINQDLATKLLGRDEVRLYKGQKQAWKVADRLIQNFATMFKQNVVLKNPASYANSFLVNQFYGLSNGVSPQNLYKYQRDAFSDLKEVTELVDKLSKQQVTGAKRDSILDARLKNNLLWKMERNGLSTNRVEGVVGDDDLLSGMLKDMTEKLGVPAVFKVGQYATLNQKTPLGRGTLKLFSALDTSGRYMIVKKHLDAGMNMKDAVKEANGVYGNMDKMVPELIELLDSRGFIPFMKWFTLISPKLLQVTKNNPKKAIATAVGLYLFGEETETNVSPFNPLQGAFDFLGDATIGKFEDANRLGIVDTIGNRARSTVIPNFIDSYKYDPMGALYRDFRKPAVPEVYQGLTQQILKGF